MRDFAQAIIPVTAIVLGLGLAFWRTYWAHQRRRLQHQERLAMIERGMTPPPEPDWDDLPGRKRRLYPLSADHALRRGVMLLCLGLGFAVAAVVLNTFGDDKDLVWIAGTAGAIIGSLGVGNLAYYFIVRDRKPAEAPPGYDARV